MENELVPNNTTLVALRGLLREARKNVPREEAVYIELKMWSYDSTQRVAEIIGVYRSEDGKGTQNFRSAKEARAYIASWKEESDATTTRSIS